MWRSGRRSPLCCDSALWWVEESHSQLLLCLLLSGTSAEFPVVTCERNPFLPSFVSYAITGNFQKILLEWVLLKLDCTTWIWLLKAKTIPQQYNFFEGPTLFPTAYIMDLSWIKSSWKSAFERLEAHQHSETLKVQKFGSNCACLHTPVLSLEGGRPASYWVLFYN